MFHPFYAQVLEQFARPRISFGASFVLCLVVMIANRRGRIISILLKVALVTTFLFFIAVGVCSGNLRVFNAVSAGLILGFVLVYFVFDYVHYRSREFEPQTDKRSSPSNEDSPAPLESSVGHKESLSGAANSVVRTTSNLRRFGWLRGSGRAMPLRDVLLAVCGIVAVTLWLMSN